VSKQRYQSARAESASKSRGTPREDRKLRDRQLGSSSIARRWRNDLGDRLGPADNRTCFADGVSSGLSSLQRDQNGLTAVSISLLPPSVFSLSPPPRPSRCLSLARSLARFAGFLSRSPPYPASLPCPATPGRKWRAEGLGAPTPPLARRLSCLFLRPFSFSCSSPVRGLLSLYTDTAKSAAAICPSLLPRAHRRDFVLPLLRERRSAGEGIKEARSKDEISHRERREGDCWE